jgi:hypothetical protein
MSFAHAGAPDGEMEMEEGKDELLFDPSQDRESLLN